MNKAFKSTNTNEAKKLFKILDKRVNPKIFPYLSEQGQKYYEHLMQRILKETNANKKDSERSAMPVYKKTSIGISYEFLLLC